MATSRQGGWCGSGEKVKNENWTFTQVVVLSLFLLAAIVGYVVGQSGARCTKCYVVGRVSVRCTK